MGRIAGIDYGTVRVGIAIADEQARIASPLEVYHRRDRAADAAYFQALVARQGITRFVVGWPIHLDGRPSAKSIEVERFADWLNKATGVQAVLFDERFTSVEAQAHLAAAGLTKKRRKERLDKLAAQILLTAYLEAPEPDPPAPRALDD